jgi:hypothetical protein
MKNFRSICIVFVLIGVSSSFKMRDVQIDSVQLFSIERNRDANQILYNLNITDQNTLDVENPMNIYWKKYTENSKIEPLTWIQNKYAYGVKLENITASGAEFKFVSYAQRTFFIKKGLDSKFHVFVYSNGKERILTKIFIQIDGGTFWFPNISRVELHTYDSNLKQQEIEIVNP